MAAAATVATTLTEGEGKEDDNDDDDNNDNEARVEEEEESCGGAAPDDGDCAAEVRPLLSRVADRFRAKSDFGLGCFWLCNEGDCAFRSPTTTAAASMSPSRKRGFMPPLAVLLRCLCRARPGVEMMLERALADRTCLGESWESWNCCWSWSWSWC